MIKVSFAVFISCFLLMSCTHFPVVKSSNKTSEPSYQTGTTQANQPVEGQEKTTKRNEKQNSYYDFDDILIPNEMELQANESIIFETPNLKAGALMFEGDVEAVSLFNFFRNNMPEDNWSLRSYFKYERYLLVFEKQEKDCVIRIQDERFKTLLYVWVTPRIGIGQQQSYEEKILTK
ncbi:MAG TPA: hypothetical protein VKN82_02190 [Desulfohalobiaceae bacterium]|nr:hypothetical protein [Desulfohalobiaceae bacterium]